MSTKTEEPDTKPSQIVVERGPYSSRNGEQLPATQGDKRTLLEALAAAATDPRTDVAKIERLWAISKEMMALEREAAFNDAMARAQARIEPIVKDKRNDHTKSMYATLAAINEAIVPIYTGEGLSITFDTNNIERDKDLPELEKGKERVVAFCSHRAGHTRKYHLDGDLDIAGKDGTKNKTGIQAVGSTNEYLRRYLVRMIFNISTYTEDDDGNSGNGGGKLTDKERADFLAKLDEADTERTLLASFATAYNKAGDVKDAGSQKLFLQHRDAKLKELRAKAARR